MDQQPEFEPLRKRNPPPVQNEERNRTDFFLPGCLHKQHIRREPHPLCRICPHIRHRPLLLPKPLHPELVGKRLDEGVCPASQPGRDPAPGGGIQTTRPHAATLDKGVLAGGRETRVERCGQILPLQRIGRAACSASRLNIHTRTRELYPLLQTTRPRLRMSGLDYGSGSQSILQLSGGRRPLATDSTRTTQRAVRQRGNASTACRSEKILGLTSA